jgi:CheY-like chemotaxis protein
VLLVEDDPMDARLALAELRRGGFAPIAVTVDSEAAYVENLALDYDVILADFSLPQFDAPRALELLQATERDIPFIILTGSIGEETAVSIMRRGAADYLLKDR